METVVNELGGFFLWIIVVFPIAVVLAFADGARRNWQRGQHDDDF
jgi:hypothetical protein